MHEEPKIYVASLSDYNAGRLVGDWFSLRDYDSADGLYEAIEDWLKKLGPSGDGLREEWAVHDYDATPDFGEYPDKKTLDDYITALDEVSNVKALNALVDAGYSPREFRDRYYGTFDSDRAFVYEYVDSSGMLEEVPEHLQFYFDYDSFARDLLLTDFTERNGHYFRTG